MFYNTFAKLCKDGGISETAAIQAIGLSTGNLKNWKNGRTPKAEVLRKTAAYFGVSVDFLLEKEATNISTEKIISDNDIKFALFGDVAEQIPDEKLQEVKKFAQFIKNEFKKEQ